MHQFSILTRPILVLLASFLTFETQAQDSNRPNILMISIDDLNDWTGFLGGHPQALTPHMDKLAKQGRVFANAHCAIPVCSSSRVSVMSGVAATTHGSYELGPAYEELPALNNVPTIQRHFKDNGYTTLVGGKVLHHGFQDRLAADVDRSLGRYKGARPKKMMNLPAGWSKAWDWGAYPENDSKLGDFQLAETAAEVQSPAETDAGPEPESDSPDSDSKTESRGRRRGGRSGRSREARQEKPEAAAAENDDTREPRGSRVAESKDEGETESAPDEKAGGRQRRSRGGRGRSDNGRPREEGRREEKPRKRDDQTDGDKTRDSDDEASGFGSREETPAFLLRGPR